MPARGYKLDSASVNALRKLIKRQAPAPVAPPIAPIRERGSGGASSGGLRLVRLAEDTVPAPTNSIPAGRTYTILDLAGNVLALKTPQASPRVLSDMTEYTSATLGLAQAMTVAQALAVSVDAGVSQGTAPGGGSTNWILVLAFEQVLTEVECSAGSGSGS